MALIVQTAEGVAGAESYASVEEADAYAEAHGWTDWTASAPATATKEAALRNATTFINLTYRARFVGSPLGTELLWPRTTPTGIPEELKAATIHAARLSLTKPLYGDPRSGLSADKKRVKAGSVEVEFREGADLRAERLSYLDLILAPLILPADFGPAIFVV